MDARLSPGPVPGAATLPDRPDPCEGAMRADASSDGPLRPGALEQLLYVSRAVPGLLPADRLRILAASQANNPSAGITGLLLYSGRFFAQVVEGECVAVHKLLARLEGDPRHDGMRLVQRRLLARREYAQWSAGLALAPELDEQLRVLQAGPSALDLQATALLRQWWLAQDDVGVPAPAS